MAKKKKDSSIDSAEEDELAKRLDAIIILNCIDNLSGEDKLNILVHSVGLSEAARILKKDKSNLAKSIKNEKKQKGR